MLHIFARRAGVVARRSVATRAALARVPLVRMPVKARFVSSSSSSSSSTTSALLLAATPPRRFVSTSSSLLRAAAPAAGDRAERMKRLQDDIDDLGEQMNEARELIQDANESHDSVYFSEDFADAMEAVADVLTDFDSMQVGLSDEEKQSLNDRIGIRVRELKQAAAALEELAKNG